VDPEQATLKRKTHTNAVPFAPNNQGCQSDQESFKFGNLRNEAALFLIFGGQKASTVINGEAHV
jgi:hypothetical protein